MCKRVVHPAFKIAVFHVVNSADHPFFIHSSLTEEDGKRNASLHQGSFPSPSFKPRGAGYEFVYCGINNTRPI